MKDTITDKDFQALLKEIETDDAEYSTNMADSIRRLQYEEMMQNELSPEEMMDDKAWSNTVRARRDDKGEFVRDAAGRVIYDFKTITYEEKKKEWDHAVKVWNQAKKNRAAETRLRKLEIQREAINSTFISIYSELTNDHKKLLIELLTAEYKAIMDRSEKFINKRIQKLLGSYIPYTLKRCKALYPESMVKNPGFMYIASKEYGEGKMIWVTPDLPYYFTQGTELQILRENEAKYLFAVDKAVLQFNENKDTLSKRELQYAMKLKNLNTFYELVNKNPFWYDTLIQELKRRVDMAENNKG